MKVPFGLLIESLERTNAEELTIDPEAIERDGRIEETVDIKRVDVLRRAVLVGKRQVALQQGADVIGPWVVE